MLPAVQTCSFIPITTRGLGSTRQVSLPASENRDPFSRPSEQILFLLGLHHLAADGDQQVPWPGPPPPPLPHFPMSSLLCYLICQSLPQVGLRHLEEKSRGQVDLAGLALRSRRSQSPRSGASTIAHGHHSHGLSLLSYVGHNPARHVHIGCGCLRAAAAELKSCDGDRVWPENPKYLPFGPL